MKITLTVLLLAANLLFAAESDTSQVLSPRRARHVLMPFIGVQTIDGEKVGFSYVNQFWDFSLRDTVYINVSETGQYSKTVPELGLIYRYMPTGVLGAELAISAIQDETELEYSYLIDIFGGYSLPDEIIVSRQSTVASSACLLLNLPVPVRWITSGIRIGGGYAWRNITTKTNLGLTSSKPDYIEASETFMLKGGLDFGFWSSNNFLFQTSISYTRFFPQGDDLDVYDGFGWRVSFFPIWSISDN